MTGKKPRHIRFNSTFNKPHYVGSGSLVGWCNRGSVIWGSGCINNTAIPSEKPLDCVAVRGPLTYELLTENNIEVQQVYGDPGLLVSNFYPKKAFGDKVGLIPHYLDKGYKFFDNEILDIQAGLKNFLDQLFECRIVFSSSLHGLIFADAYGIPSYWVEVSDNVIGKGFKFRDYFGSLGQTEEERKVDWTGDILKQAEDYDVSDRVSEIKQNLLSVCPFI